MNFHIELFTIPLAVLIDFFLGDPLFLPHPIRWMGTVIIHLEPRMRRIPVHPVLSGGLMAVLLIALTFIFFSAVVSSCRYIHPFFSFIIETSMIFYAISGTSLHKAAISVYSALKRKDVRYARYLLSLIVGRDVDELMESGILRATIETTSENFVDGILSPLFFAAMGGGPLALTYKMVNTLDSMVGYRDERYEKFGKVSARIDDIVNFIPARLSVLFIAISAQLLYGTGRQSWMTALKEGREHKSPNSGFPEAAFAGGLKISLNGPAVYKGRVLDKPYIGKGNPAPVSTDILRGCDILCLSTLLATILFFSLRLFL